MKEFTGYQYLLMDVASHSPLGLDKKEFEERIEWAEAQVALSPTALEEVAAETEWKEKPMYIKAVMALRKAQQGIATGHLVSFDAVCSGMQIMSALTGCYEGAKATGLVDPDRRADAYTQCTTLMSKILGYSFAASFMQNGNDLRKRVKNAVMTSLYGSRAEPIKEFGEDTPELKAFSQAIMQMAPGACQMLQDLLDSWQAWALSHGFIMPDGFDVRIKVKQRVEHQIEVDELAHSRFTYVYYENAGEEKGVKNVANTTHSVDAYILRSVLRRCNYDKDVVQSAASMIQVELLERSMVSWGAGPTLTPKNYSSEIKHYLKRYESNKMPDIYILPYLTPITVRLIDTNHLKKLSSIINDMLKHEPFEVVTIHDDYKCHPNNMNELRYHYREILAELADSTLLADLLSQLHGITGGKVTKLSTDLSKYIRKSNYSLS